MNQTIIIMLPPVFLWDEKCLRRVQPERIVGLTTQGNYTKVFLDTGNYYMVRVSLSRAHKKLPQNMFIRIHRSYVISIYHMDEIKRDHLLVGKEPIPIAKQYYKRLMSKLVVLE